MKNIDEIDAIINQIKDKGRQQPLTLDELNEFEKRILDRAKLNNELIDMREGKSLISHRISTRKTFFFISNSEQARRQTS